MKSAQLGIILRRLREIAPPSMETDAELLARYVRGDQSAFTALVERYSELVWGVGRRVLRKRQDGEDVFQATFLALSRKAHQLHGERSLAPWLYTVAVRLALKVKSRQPREANLMDMPEPVTLVDASVEIMGRELAQVFDEEMAQLPHKYREAVILCCLEGQSRDEAAGVAGCSMGAMKNRLERGRNLLRKRLEHRGIAVPATLLLVGLTSRSVPAALCAAACRVTESASPAVAALVGEVLGGSMMMKSIVVTVALGLSAACIGIGASVFGDSEPNAKGPPAAIAQAKPPVKDQPPEDAKPGKEQPADDAQVRLDNFGRPLPEDALARFGTTYLRAGNISNFLYSPDGKMMAIVSNYDTTLGLWDIASGKELFRLADMVNHEAPSLIVAFSPDGKILADDNRGLGFRLWDTQTGKLIREIVQNAVESKPLLFSTDGKTLMVGDVGKISFWEIGTGTETATINHSATVNTLAISKDGKLLASGAMDNVLRVWNAKTHELLKELPGKEEGIIGLSFSPDGKQLASTYSSGICLVWDPIKGEVIHKLDDSYKAANSDESTAWSAAFSPNGKWLATSYADNNGTIRLWNLEIGKEVRHWDTQNMPWYRLAFSADSKTIASQSGQDSSIRFWDVETGKETHVKEGHRAVIDGLSLSLDGRFLWSLSLEDRRTIRWNTATTRVDEMIPIPSEGEYGLATLSPSGPFLAWGSNSEKTIHIMDLNTRKDACKPLKIEANISYNVNSKEIPTLQFSPDGKVLAFAYNSSYKSPFTLWKWQTNRTPKVLKAQYYNETRPIFTPDSMKILTASFLNPDPSAARSSPARELYWWDVETGQMLYADAFPTTLRVHAFSPNGRWLLISHEKRPNTQVIDVKTRKIAREIKTDLVVRTAAFSLDGYLLALGEDAEGSSNVNLVEFLTGETIDTWKGHTAGIRALQFSTDGRVLYSGGGDTTILKWDATGRHDQKRSTPNLESAWNALAQNASKAYPAKWDFVDSPKEGMALLRDKLLPEKLSVAQYQQLLDDLDGEGFQKREKAKELLKTIGYSVELWMRTSLEAEKREVVKEELQKLLEELKGASLLRIQRAMQILETINNEEARKLLLELADGRPGSTLTRKAVQVLKRLRVVGSGE